MPPPPPLWMATRLPFLYPPTLLRAFSSTPKSQGGARPLPQRAALQPHVVSRTRIARHAAAHHHAGRRGAAAAPYPPPRRKFSNSPCRCRAAFAARHGKAVEPLLSLGADKMRKENAPAGGTVQDVGKGGAGGEWDAKVRDGVAAAAAAVAASAATGAASTSASPALSATPSAGSTAPTSTSPSPSPSDEKGLVSTSSSNPGAVRESKTDAKMSGPMQAVLYMGMPSNGGRRGFPPPGYVHHFDSHTLVKHLQAGGYTLVQSITSMKAIRGLLERNLTVAQGTLVSKIDAENESYLFRAACSELGAEVKNNRRTADEDMRQQRILLQHEVDILTQTLNQELLTLTDNVRGMFNDRRMTVREEQRTTEAKIQQLTYKISISLSSDAKSEIESLRWILIRRSVLGIIFMAVLTLGTLRYATYVSHERQKEADRRKKEKEERWRHDGMKDQSSAPDAAVILAAS